MKHRLLVVSVVCMTPALGITLLNTSDLTLKEALEYKKLTPLHQGLRDMEKETAMLCAPAAQVHGPHYKPVIQTYGNKTATKGAKMKKNPRFAVGSLLVKEKYESKSAKQPSLITVMKKVYEGSGARTWQYMMIDLSKNKVLSSVDPKKLKDPAANKCISCHDNYSGSDGVSMSFAKG